MNTTLTIRRLMLRSIFALLLPVLLGVGGACSLRIAEAAFPDRGDSGESKVVALSNSATVDTPDGDVWWTFLPLAARRYSAIRPLNVTPVADNARAVGLELPLAGGALTATAANGTRFTLTIPADALVVTTTITMTPLSAIQGLPADELIGAVTLEPAELFLYQPAMLTVEPVQALPVVQELTFSFYAGGADFHRFPLMRDEPGVVIPVVFLRSYGLARQQPSIQAQKTSWTRPLDASTYRPASVEAQFQQRIADIFHEMRVRDRAGLPPDPTLDEQLSLEFDRYYKEIIEPLLGVMHAGCPDTANVRQVLGWARQMQLLGQDDDSDQQAAVSAAVAAGLQNCYRKAAEPCLDFDWDRQIGDPAQVQLVLGYLRQMALLGGEESPPFSQLPRCPIVEVRPGSDGGFIYPFQPDPESGWFTKVHFLFPDANARTVVHVNTLNNRGAGAPLAQVHARLKMPGKDWVDEDWTNLPYPWFCRDMAAGRIEELIITSSPVITAPVLAPSLDASNVGCWRWTAEVVMTDTKTNRQPPNNWGYSSTLTREGHVVFESQEARGVMDLPVASRGYNYALNQVSGGSPYVAIAGHVDASLVLDNFVHPDLTPVCHIESTWSFLPHEQLRDNVRFVLALNPRFRAVAASVSEDGSRQFACPPGSFGVGTGTIPTNWWLTLGAEPFGADGMAIPGNLVRADLGTPPVQWTQNFTWNMTAESQP